MASLHFSTARQIVDSLVDEGVKIRMSEDKDTASDGDLRRVADEYGLTDNTTVRKWTVEIVGRESDESYASVVYYNFIEDPSVSLFDWVEVDPEFRGNGVGRALVEEAVKHIEAKTSTEETYLKLENPQLRSVLIDVGFVEVDMGRDTWLVR